MAPVTTWKTPIPSRGGRMTSVHPEQTMCWQENTSKSARQILALRVCAPRVSTEPLRGSHRIGDHRQPRTGRISSSGTWWRLRGAMEVYVTHDRSPQTRVW